MFCPPHFQFVLLWYSSQASPVCWPGQFCCLGIFYAGAENRLDQCQEVDGNITASPVKTVVLSCYQKSQRDPQRGKRTTPELRRAPRSSGPHTGRLSVHLVSLSRQTPGSTFKLKHCPTWKHHSAATFSFKQCSTKLSEEYWNILLRNTQWYVAERCCRTMQYYNTQNCSSLCQILTQLNKMVSFPEYLLPLLKRSWFHLFKTLK